MKVLLVASCPAAVDLWAALDLIVRRYEIGELVAAGQHARAQIRIRQYVDAVGIRP